MFMCMCIWVNIHTHIVFVLSAEKTWKHTSEVTSTSNAQMLVSMLLSNNRNGGLLGDVVDCMAEVGIIQHKPGVSCSDGKKEVTE